jgi:hypothetical protein
MYPTYHSPIVVASVIVRGVMASASVIVRGVMASVITIIRVELLQENRVT